MKEVCQWDLTSVLRQNSVRGCTSGEPVQKHAPHVARQEPTKRRKGVVLIRGCFHELHLVVPMVSSKHWNLYYLNSVLTKWGFL